MEKLSIEKAAKYGIENSHSILDNGEKRFRQICNTDKTAYIRTEGANKGYWQNSHFHKSVRELYIVQKGKILFAQYINNKLKINIVNENGICKTEPNTPHNVYMYPNTVMHTVKYGDIKEYDWIEFKTLDDILANMTIEELEKYSNNIV